MGRTSRVYELITKMAQKEITQGFPTESQVKKMLQPYEATIQDLLDRVAALEGKDKGGKKHGN